MGNKKDLLTGSGLVKSAFVKVQYYEYKGQWYPAREDYMYIKIKNRKLKAINGKVMYSQALQLIQEEIPSAETFRIQFVYYAKGFQKGNQTGIIPVNYQRPDFDLVKMFETYGKQNIRFD